MSIDYVSLWDRCLSIIKDNVSVEHYKTWFEPIRAVKYVDNELTVQVPNTVFSYEYLEEILPIFFNIPCYVFLWPWNTTDV